MKHRRELDDDLRALAFCVGLLIGATGAFMILVHLLDKGILK